MNEDMTVQTPPKSKSASADLVSLVAALIFGAAGVIVLAGESLAEVDPVVLAGIALIAIGVARIVMVPVQASARRRALRAERDDSETPDPDEDAGQDSGEDPGETPDPDENPGEAPDSGEAEDRLQDKVKD